MNTSKFIRAALPMLAVVGFASFSSDVDAATLGNKHIFNYVEMTSDLTGGYARESYRVEAVTERSNVATDLFPSPIFLQDDRVHARRDMEHIRAVNTFDVYEGPLIHSFMELETGIVLAANDKLRYDNRLDAAAFVSSTGTQPAAIHFFKTIGEGKSGTRKAFDSYNAHLIFGYDLSKTRPGNKSTTFKPFVGYFVMRSHTPRRPVDGCYLSAELDGAGNPVNVLLPARAYVETMLYWHGFLFGGMTETRWFNNSVTLRGDARFCRARSHQLTTEIETRGISPGVTLVQEAKMKMARDRSISTWRFLGYSASIIYKRHIPLTNITFFAETTFMRMRDKRYSDRALSRKSSAGGVATAPLDHASRIEKIWHHRTSGHAGISISY